MVKKLNTDKGGLLVGKTDRDNGEGIVVQAPEGKIIMGGGEIIINEEAAKLHCEELSKINESTGGVAIPCDLQKSANHGTGRLADGGKLERYEREEIENQIENLREKLYNEKDETKTSEIKADIYDLQRKLEEDDLSQYNDGGKLNNKNKMENNEHKIDIKSHGQSHENKNIISTTTLSWASSAQGKHFYKVFEGEKTHEDIYNHYKEKGIIVNHTVIHVLHNTTKDRDLSAIRKYISTLVKDQFNTEINPDLLMMSYTDHGDNGFTINDFTFDLNDGTVIKYNANDQTLTKQLASGGKINENVQLDTDAQRELELYIENDSDLYTRQTVPIIKNLITKLAQGKYEHEKAAKLFMYLVEAGDKKYNKEFNNATSGYMLSVPDRKALAKTLEEQFYETAEFGEYDHFIPAKYKAKGIDYTKVMADGGKVDSPGTTRNKMIYDYIIDAIDSSGYDVETKTDAEKVKFVWNTFKSEYGHELKQLGPQRAFVNWVQGLPSSFNVDYENYKIIELGKKWGILKENATELKEDKFIESWWARMFMGLRAAARKNKVNLDNSMASGGKIENQYQGKTPAQVWAEWTHEQRRHFLIDHYDELFGITIEEGSKTTDNQLLLQKWDKEKYSKLNKKVKAALETHIDMGEFKKGAEIHSPSDLPKDGSDINIHMPKMGIFPAQDIVLKYDQKNFRFNIFDESNKKLGTIGEKEVLSNLDNNLYQLANKKADGGKVRKFKKGDKVKTREGKIETVIKVNSNGNVETEENDYSWPPYTLELQMAHGGTVDNPTIKEIATKTGVRASAIEEYLKENSSNSVQDSALKILTGLGRKQINHTLISTAISGTKGNKASKELISYIESNKAFTYTKKEAGGALTLDIQPKNDVADDYHPLMSFEKGGRMKELCEAGTEVQTIIFDKKKFSKKKAVEWAKDHGFKSRVEINESSYRTRQIQPKSFKPTSLRTTNFDGKLPEGIQVVVGCLRANVKIKK